MQKNILLPQLELTMDSVLVVNWLVKVGDQVNDEQPILEVESQKGIMEVPAQEAGYVRKLCVKPGDTISEKALLCLITPTADEAFEEGPAAVAPASSAKEHPSLPSSSKPKESNEAGGDIRAAPAARKRARELDLDLATIPGTGPGGRITVEDVENSKARGTDAPGGGDGGWTSLSPSRIGLIAQMQKSLAEIPQFHVARQMDVKPLTVKTEGITFTHRLVRAVAAALARHPVLRTLINGHSVRIEPVSVSIAMDTIRGLFAPAIRSADTLSLEQIAGAAKDLKKRADAGAIKREELAHAPFALSNLGMLGVDSFNAFVFHGQTAVLAIGRAVDGKSWFNLAVDHRIVDGAEAARFLETLQQEILKS